MPNPRVERKEFTFVGVDGGNTIAFHRLSRFDRVIACTARVRQACDGDGAVTIGRQGAASAFMVAGDVAATVAGRKTAATGAGLAGNGFRAIDETDAQSLVQCVYTETTATIVPIITIVLLIIRESTMDDLFIA